jgi:hypothetical protein
MDQQIDAKTEGIAQSKSMLEILRSNYSSDRKQLSELRLKVQRDTALLKIKKDILRGFDEERKKLAENVSRNEVMIAGLTREVSKMSGVADGVASKAEEIQLSNLSARQASRTGVQILYRAEPNPQKVGPNRTKNLLLVIILTFLGGVFVVTARLYMGLVDLKATP